MNLPDRTPEQKIYDAQAPKEKVESIDEVVNTPSGLNSLFVFEDDISYEIRKIVADCVGVDIGGYRHVVDSSSIKHAYNKHLHDSIPLVLDDFWKISDIIKSADIVLYAGKNRKGLDVIKYLKSFENAQIAYLEEIRNGKHQLAMDTMYWVRKIK